MLRPLIAIVIVLLGTPYCALQLGHRFQSQIAASDNSAVPWRRARLSYRIAKFSPLLWSTAAKEEDQTDLILSDHFFSQVLRGEQDAIVPQNHLDFLNDRPNTDVWNLIHAQTLLQYGSFSDAQSFSQSHQNINLEPITAISAWFTGDLETLASSCKTWTDCPLGWSHTLPFEEALSDDLASAVTEGLWYVDWKQLPEKDQPLFVEWALLQENSNFTIAIEELDSHKEQPMWNCARLVDATRSLNPEGLQSILPNFWGEDGSTWLFSYGSLLQETTCHPDRFGEAAEVSLEVDFIKWKLLEAASYTTLLNISKAQSLLKFLIQSESITNDEKILALHLRVINRELAGDPLGMEKYITLGLPLHRSLFSIHLGRSKIYQQEKTTAIQSLSALNGYPIPPKLQQEYTDLLMLSKRLNGSSSKLQIGSHQLSYDFMDNDGNFREWLVKYQGEQMDNPVGTPMTIPLLRFWRGEDKHSDQLLQTHLEHSVNPLVVMMTTHQRFLEASLRSNKSLTSSTWKQFSKTRTWLDDLQFPQMLQTHSELYRSDWPR